MSGRIRPRAAGIKQLEEGPAAAKATAEAGKKVATAARAAASGIRIDGTPGDEPVPIDEGPSQDNPTGYVVRIPHAAGLAVESKYRVLGSSLPAAGS